MLLKCVAKYKIIMSLLMAWYLMSFSQVTLAHVKWFSPYDVVADPKSIFDVLSPLFLSLMAASAVVIFLVSWFDRTQFAVSINQQICDYRQSFHDQFPGNFSAKAMRYAALIFFVSLWSIGGVILTPELTDDNSLLIGTLHLVVIIGLMTQKTSKYAGAGIIALWLYATYQYGFFHLADYIIFIALGLFMILISSGRPQLMAVGFLILYLVLSASLQWGSIEKFLYPQWTFPILEERPYLSFGLNSSHFMVLAGFVELVLAFLLLCTSGLMFVLTAIGFSCIFMLAIIDFGKIDAIGHLIIIASLVLMVVTGPSVINKKISNLHSKPLYNAFFTTLIYFVSIAFFFALYYLVRSLWMMVSSH